MEALRLQVKSLVCERRELTVRDGKGSKDRRTMLALGSGERLRVQRRTRATARSAPTQVLNRGPFGISSPVDTWQSS